MKTPWEYAEATNTEHAHQVALFMWANMAANFGLYAANDPLSYVQAGKAKSYDGAKPMPQLKWLFAIHNQGHGDAIRGGKARAEGVKAGVPDLCLPCLGAASLGHMRPFGLYIELKRPKIPGKSAGVKSLPQIEWEIHLRSQGYRCVTCYGFEEARKAIIDYLIA